MNILVLLPFNDEQRARIEAAAPDATFAYSTRAGVETELVAQADVIVGNLAPARLREAPHLKFMQLNSAGYDAYMAPGAVPEGVRLASAVGAYGQAVSEHMLAMVLMLMKRLHTYRDDSRDHAWIDRGNVTTINGAQVLVLGCGDIGAHFARLCQSLGAHVYGVRRRVGEVPDGFESVHTMDELPGLLSASDVVVSFLPAAPETDGLADASFFAACKPGAYFANGGRGSLVVQDDLAAALESGQLAGAALDVTTPEPLPADHPLWDAPNIFITPHVAGQFHLYTVLDNISQITAENLRHFQKGEPLRNEI